MYIHSETRICTSCLKEKSTDHFYRDRKSFRAVCKECTSKGLTSQKTGVVTHKRIYILPKRKICSACEVEKDIEEFHFDKRDRPRSQCKKCHRSHINDYRKVNKDKWAKQQKESQKKYHAANPEYLKNWWKDAVKEAKPTYIKWQIIVGRKMDPKTVSDFTVDYIRKTLLLRREIDAQGKSPFKDA